MRLSVTGTSPCQDRLRAQICGKHLLLLDKINGYSSFSRGHESRWSLHHMGEMQPPGTERSQYLSHYGLLDKVLCHPAAPCPARQCPSLPQSSDFISIIMINLAQLFSSHITYFLRAGLQCPWRVSQKQPLLLAAPCLAGRRNRQGQMIWGAKPQLCFQARSRGDLWLGKLERPMSRTLQQPKKGWVGCPWPCHHHLSTSAAGSQLPCTSRCCHL